MKDRTFEEIVKESLNEALAPEKLKQKIDDSINVALGSVFKDIFSPYGDFSKKIKKQLEEQLSVAVLDLRQIPALTDTIIKTISANIESWHNKEVLEIAHKSTNDFLIGQPSKISMRELVEKMKAHFYSTIIDKEELDEYDEVCAAVDVRESYDWFWVSLDPVGSTKDYDCRYRFSVNSKGKVDDIKINGYPMKNLILLEDRPTDFEIAIQRLSLGLMTIDVATIGEFDREYEIDWDEE